MDNIYYLLSYKKNMNSSLDCHKSIITLLDEVLDNLTKVLYSDASKHIKHIKIINEIVHIKDIYICKNAAIEHQIITNDNNIYTNCEHEFVEDYIDVTPDISQKIIYCTICELSKRDIIPLSRL